MLKKAILFLFLFTQIAFSGLGQYIKWQEDNASSFLRLNITTHEISRYRPGHGWKILDTLQTIDVDFRDIKINPNRFFV